ncbi:MULTISPECIES: DUF6412 domain-containing protein [unclassified Microbacterium]|uniref:DUF6412 domain-containing protein n=1 Tax=unclassified Microbacterium TaxID=2609290 RepID=UPI003746A997
MTAFGEAEGRAMIDAIGSFLRILFSSMGLIAEVEPGTVTVVAAALLATALVVALVHAVALRPSARSSLARPRRTIDVSAPLLQSDPDAAGHPRSRAPGSAVSAA